MREEGARTAVGRVVEECVVAVKELQHLIFVEEAQIIHALHLVTPLLHLEHGAGHAEVEVDALAAADGVLVHERMDDTAVAVDRHAPAQRGARRGEREEGEEGS